MEDAAATDGERGWGIDKREEEGEEIAVQGSIGRVSDDDVVPSERNWDKEVAMTHARTSK